MMDWALVIVSWTIGSVLLVLASVIIRRRLKFLRKAIKGYATITEFHCNPTDMGRRFHPVFEFEIDGKTICQESEYGFNLPAVNRGKNRRAVQSRQPFSSHGPGVQSPLGYRNIYRIRWHCHYGCRYFTLDPQRSQPSHRHRGKKFPFRGP